MEYKRGDILKFSNKGLDWLYGDRDTREQAKTKRFEYRCVARKFSDCISVKPEGKEYYLIYFKTFLERASDKGQG